ncbi:MAG: hypothetical protein WCL10_00050 [Novosphingobium sp.]|uniref:hypothetical protein n=1 Tax=Novosphingobium sp. TaxID=1874826 RepID=UPI003017C3FE
MKALIAGLTVLALATPVSLPAAPAHRPTGTPAPKPVAIAPVPKPPVQLPVFEFMGQTTEAPPTMTELQGAKCVTSNSRYTCTNVSFPTVAGRPMRYLQIAFFNERLYAVSAAFGELAYQPVLEAFTAKYGKPDKVEVRKWQSKAGATFDNQVSIWNFSGGGTLELQSMGSQVGEGRFDFISTTNAPPTEAPKVDF